MFNQNYETVTSTIPEKFNFTDGSYSNMITDGGNDMYIIILFKII